MSDEPRCRWVASDEPRVLVGRHPDPMPDGHEADCAGCRPCEKAHCIVCGHEHAAATCAACVGDVREGLDATRDLCARLRLHATHGSDRNGRPLAAKPIPGADAMVMLGPGSEGTEDQWERTGGFDRLGYPAWLGYAPDEALNLPSDPTPPLLVLATWEDVWRAQFGHEAAGKATIRGCLDYLDRHLAHAAQQFEPPFDEFARDIRRLRGRLEDVVYAGERDERTRTPCLGCGRRLVVVFGERAKDDHWKCPKCRLPGGKHRTYNAEEYAKAKTQHLQSEQADAWVRISDAAHSLERSEWTLRTWIKPRHQKRIDGFTPGNHVDPLPDWHQDSCLGCLPRRYVRGEHADPLPEDHEDDCKGCLPHPDDCPGCVPPRVQSRRLRVEGEGGVMIKVLVYWPDVRRAHALTPTRERSA